MADDGKPEHYAVKQQKRIEELERENATLREAAALSVSVASPSGSTMPDAPLFAAAFIAGHEALGGGGDITSLLKTRWRSAHEFLTWVRAGKDKEAFAETDAKVAALAAKAAKDEADVKAAEAARKAQALAAVGAK